MPIIMKNGKIDTVSCEDCIYFCEQDSSCYKYTLLDDYCKYWEQSEKAKQKPKRPTIKRTLKL